MKKILLAATAALVLFGATGCKEKNNAYPKKGVTMICPWGAGGGTDAILRAVCSTAEKYLGTTITVENKTGGAGSIGFRAIKDAKPDGYTLGMITFELNSNPWQGLQDFTYEAYDPLIMVNTDAATITVKLTLQLFSVLNVTVFPSTLLPSASSCTITLSGRLPS